QRRENQPIRAEPRRGNQLSGAELSCISGFIHVSKLKCYPRPQEMNPNGERYNREMEEAISSMTK
ncbi:hypothetical protein KI387_003069, partial [Taxus chinensis]